MDHRLYLLKTMSKYIMDRNEMNSFGGNLIPVPVDRKKQK